MTHLFFEMAAFAVGGLLYWRRGNAATQPSASIDRWALIAGAALGAAAGSRLLFALQYWHALQGEGLAAWLGGKTVVGGLLGGLIGVEIAKRAVGWRLATGNGFAWPLLAALIIGRIGCQLAGLADQTYGNATSLPWGWDYGDGISRHPTALYEILLLCALALVMHRPRWDAVAGDRFRVFMVGYLTLRLLLEFLKPPFGPAAVDTLLAGHWFVLTAIQWACLAGLAYYARDLRRWMR
jgi:phosphatidylglycerol---prolipoprotein diacylglyceryl transferase